VLRVALGGALLDEPSTAGAAVDLVLVACHRKPPGDASMSCS
jgi:hypothetical protein